MEAGTYGLMFIDNAKGREGGGTNLSTGEGDLLSILCDDERLTTLLIIQHGSRLEDLQIFVSSVLHGGNDPQVRQGCDVVGGSRKVDFETTGGTDGGVGVSTDDRKAKGNKRRREHGEGKEVEGSWIGAGYGIPKHLTLFILPKTPHSAAETQVYSREMHGTGERPLMWIMRNDRKRSLRASSVSYRVPFVLNGSGIRHEGLTS